MFYYVRQLFCIVQVTQYFKNEHGLQASHQRAAGLKTPILRQEQLRVNPKSMLGNVWTYRPADGGSKRL